MKPTMKLRILKKSSLYKGDPYMVSAYEEEYFVLQQWWYEPCPEVLPEDCDGEWRDITVEVEIT